VTGAAELEGPGPSTRGAAGARRDGLGRRVREPLLWLGRRARELLLWLGRRAREPLLWLGRRAREPLLWLVAAAAAAALLGAFLDPQGWVVGGLLAALVAVGVAWPRLAAVGLRAELAFERRRVVEGEPAPVRLTVVNRCPWPVSGLLVGGLREEIDGEVRPEAALGHVGGWSRATFRFAFTPPRRGVYPAGSVRLATGFPLGLATGRAPVRVPAELLAWPGHAEGAPLAPDARATVAALGDPVDRSGDEGEVIGVRPYRVGDPLRGIHWSHSARRDALVVRDRQRPGRAEVAVALDAAAFLDVDRALVDEATRVVATLARRVAELRWDLRCALGGAVVRVAPTAAGLRGLLDRLARFRPEDAPPASGAGAIRRGGPRRVVVTLAAGPPAAVSVLEPGARQPGRLRRAPGAAA